MKFSDAEMLFFNSLIDGKGIFGLDIKRPFVADQAFIEKTIEGLKEKKIILEDGKLADIHPNPIIQLEFYKQASTYIVFNQTRIALTDEDNMVGILFDEGGYHLFSCQTWRYLHELFLNTPILNEKIKDYPFGEEQETNLEEYVQTLASSNYDESAVFRKYTSGKIKNEYTFLWNDDRIEYFNGISSSRKEIDGQEARILLFDLFDITKMQRM